MFSQYTSNFSYWKYPLFIPKECHIRIPEKAAESNHYEPGEKLGSITAYGTDKIKIKRNLTEILTNKCRCMFSEYGCVFHILVLQQDPQHSRRFKF